MPDRFYDENKRYWNPTGKSRFRGRYNAANIPTKPAFNWEDIQKSLSRMRLQQSHYSVDEGEAPAGPPSGVESAALSMASAGAPSPGGGGDKGGGVRKTIDTLRKAPFGQLVGGAAKEVAKAATVPVVGAATAAELAGKFFGGPDDMLAKGGRAVSDAIFKNVWGHDPEANKRKLQAGLPVDQMAPSHGPGYVDPSSKATPETMKETPVGKTMAEPGKKGDVMRTPAGPAVRTDRRRADYLAMSGKIDKMSQKEKESLIAKEGIVEVIRGPALEREGLAVKGETGKLARTYFKSGIDEEFDTLAEAASGYRKSEEAGKEIEYAKIAQKDRAAKLTAGAVVRAAEIRGAAVVAAGKAGEAWTDSTDAEGNPFLYDKNSGNPVPVNFNETDKVVGILRSWKFNEANVAKTYDILQRMGDIERQEAFMRLPAMTKAALKEVAAQKIKKDDKPHMETTP